MLPLKHRTQQAAVSFICSPTQRNALGHVVLILHLPCMGSVVLMQFWLIQLYVPQRNRTRFTYFFFLPEKFLSICFLCIMQKSHNCSLHLLYFSRRKNVYISNGERNRKSTSADDGISAADDISAAHHLWKTA